MIKLEKSGEVPWDRGWGFCEGCAFEVPVDVITGVLLEHARTIGNAECVCDGSGRTPTPQPALEVKPKNTVGCSPPKVPPVRYGLEALHGPEPE